jgi:hypothetical protein
MKAVHASSPEITGITNSQTQSSEVEHWSGVFPLPPCISMISPKVADASALHPQPTLSPDESPQHPQQKYAREHESHAVVAIIENDADGDDPKHAKCAKQPM